MYWQYFNLNSNPFGITPDPKFLYLSNPHNSAIEWMRFAIEQHEFGLVVGEVGSGKTVLSRYLIDNLPENDIKVCWIINPILTPGQLLKEIHVQLINEKAPRSKSDLIKAIQEGLVNLFLNNIYPVVVIDEAQAIPGSRIFEELRLLSNYQTDEQNLISIILLGQPELANKLKRKNYRAFLQRIRFTINLEPLSREEIKKYLEHRLMVAGSNEEIFTPEAIDEIHHLTGGYPRPINHLASFSMMDAASNERYSIDAKTVRSAAKSILYFSDKLEPEEIVT